jgi:hypothetical protein
MSKWSKIQGAMSKIDADKLANKLRRDGMKIVVKQETRNPKGSYGVYRV